MQLVFMSKISVHTQLNTAEFACGVYILICLIEVRGVLAPRPCTAPNKLQK